MRSMDSTPIHSTMESPASRDGNKAKIAQVLNAVALTESLPSESRDMAVEAESNGIPSRATTGSESISEDEDKMQLEKGFSVTRKRKFTESAAENDDESGFQSSEDQEFVWEDYLSETGSMAAPPTLFLHVEQSLENGYKEGMMMEVPNSEVPGTYWVASVITTCGPLLSLRYVGCRDDRALDFWWDATTAEVHPLGWCTQNGKQLVPPKAIQEKHENPLALLDEVKGATTIPYYLLDVHGTTPIDFIKQGMKLEVQEELNPLNVWIVTVLENVGGRLLLRYDGMESASHDFWLFYLSVRIHLIGWTLENGCQYQPPEFLKDQHSKEEWQAIVQNAKNEDVSVKPLSEIFQAQESLSPHSFQVGMKLEVLHPAQRVHLCPATVTNVINEYFFLVEIDDLQHKDGEKPEPVRMCCHLKCSTVFPAKWGSRNGLQVQAPKGYLEMSGEKTFEWDKYLEFCQASAAPETLFLLETTNRGYECGMKLEAVNPIHPNQICAATISRIVPPLLWIQLDSTDASQSQFIVPFNSMEIFPVGWAESNAYPLKPPKQDHGKQPKKMRRTISTSEKAKTIEKSSSKSSRSDNAKAWCPRIYFNHMCFSGPYLSKRRLAELPQHVGPGSVNLVMKEVLTMLINVAYKSSRVLKELQFQGRPRPNYQQQVLKAKYKGKSYRATVEIVRWADQVEEFCKSICRKIECCPYLFGPKHVGNECPEKCHTMTKTKFSCMNGTAAKPLPHGRRRKRKWQMLKLSSSTEQNKVTTTTTTLTEKKSADSSKDGGVATKENATNAAAESEEVSSSTTTSDGSATSLAAPAVQKKRPYLRLVPPKSGIVTRGAKIPNFSLEMKRQWKRREPAIRAAELARQAARRAAANNSHVKPVATKTPKETTKVAEPAKKQQSSQPPVTNGQIPVPEVKPVEMLHLKSNPLKWSVDDVVQFIKSTECAPLARVLYEQEIDGQALLLLTLPTVQEFLELKLGPAIKFCHLIERVKLAFYTQFGK